MPFFENLLFLVLFVATINIRETALCRLEVPLESNESKETAKNEQKFSESKP